MTATSSVSSSSPIATPADQYSNPGLVSINMEELIKQGVFFEVDRTNLEVLSNDLLNSLGNIDTCISMIQHFTNSLTYAAKSPEWRDLLFKNIDELTTRIDETCNKTFGIVIEGLAAENDLSQIPKSMAWQLAALMMHYAVQNYEVEYLDEDGNNIEDDRISYLKPFVILQASLLVQRYALGVSQNFPDFSECKTLDDLFEHEDQQELIEAIFQSIVPELTSNQWLDKTQSLNPVELTTFSKTLRYLARATHELLLRKIIPSTQEKLTFIENILQISHCALVHYPQEINGDLDIVHNELFELVNEDFKFFYQNLADDALANNDILDQVKWLNQWKELKRSPFRTKRKISSILTSQKSVRQLAKRPTQGRAMLRYTETNGEFVTHMVTHAQAMWEDINAMEEEHRLTFHEFYRFVTDRHYQKVNYDRYYRSKSQYMDKASIIGLDRKGKDSPIFTFYNYLRGFIGLDQLGLSKSNALEFLKKIKLFDLAAALQQSSGLNFTYERTSYELRTKILELLPHLKSFEVFMNTLHPQKMREMQTWLAPQNWVSEQVALRAKAIANQYIVARTLSERLKYFNPNGVVIGPRGNSGSGKSTFIRRLVGFLGKGTLNPDYTKAFLKRGRLLNGQIHEEGSGTFKKLFKEIAYKGKLNFILDTRLITYDEVKTDLIEPAKKRGCVVRLADFDVSLKTSICRIFTRMPKGEDPCPPLEAVIDGFILIRKHRFSIIESIRDDKIVDEYILYKGAKQQLVAVKSKNRFTILDEAAYKKSLEEVPLKKIERIVSEVIDEAFVNVAIERKYILPSQRIHLEKWYGKEVKDAYRMHANGEKA